MAAYLTFLLDLGAGGDNRLVEGSLSFVPDPKRRPETAFVWRVTCDARGYVIIRAHGNHGYGVIATARWDGSLDERKQRDTTPTEFQWNLVQTAMETASALRKADPSPYDDSLVEDISPAEARALADFEHGLPSTILDGKRVGHAPRRFTPAAEKRRKRVVLFAAAPFVLVFAGVLILRCTSTRSKASEPRPAPQPVYTPPPAEPATPAPPPRPETLDDVIARTPDLAPEQLARYRVRWSDVDVPSQTTLAKVEKDPGAEKGKRVCAEGTLERITKTGTHYTGSLVTKDGDRLVFLVGGSTGELLKRDAAKLCGVVTGTVDGSTHVFGMFDLPENRNPVVEKP